VQSFLLREKISSRSLCRKGFIYSVRKGGFVPSRIGTVSPQRVSISPLETIDSAVFYLFIPFGEGDGFPRSKLSLFFSLLAKGKHEVILVLLFFIQCLQKKDYNMIPRTSPFFSSRSNTRTFPLSSSTSADRAG